MKLTAKLLDLLRDSKTNKALGGALLPANNNAAFLPCEGVYTVTVLDESGENPIAIGAINQYTSSQAYCMLGKIDEKYTKKRIWVKEAKAPAGDTDPNSHYIQIHKCSDEFPNLSGLPQYTQAFAEHSGRTLHAHLIDALLACSVGTENMDSKKNITVDLYDDEAADASGGEWRDDTGFVVADKFRYVELTLDRSQLLTVVNAAEKPNGIEICDVDKSTLNAVVDYDAVVTLHNRQNFVEHLFSTDCVNGKVALNHHGDSVGYAFVLDNHVLLCYGENEDIQRCLMLAVVGGINAEKVSCTIREDSSALAAQLQKIAVNGRRMHRFHTRLVPTQVKWDKVLTLNTGLNLF